MILKLGRFISYVRFHFFLFLFFCSFPRYCKFQIWFCNLLFCIIFFFFTIPFVGNASNRKSRQTIKPLFPGKSNKKSESPVNKIRYIYLVSMLLVAMLCRYQHVKMVSSGNKPQTVFFYIYSIC